MTVTFGGLLLASTPIAPGTRVRTVWGIDLSGSAYATFTPSTSADVLRASAAKIVSALTSRGIGYALNAPVTVPPGAEAMVIDLKTSAAGGPVTAGNLAAFLADIPRDTELVKLSLIPAGESATASQTAREQEQVLQQRAEQSQGPWDFLTRAGGGLVTALKWGGVIVLVLGLLYLSTFLPKGKTS